MQYKQKITQIGNSLGIVIPKQLRDSLKLDLGTEVTLSKRENANQMVVSTEARDVDVDPTFYKLLKKVDQQYSKALKELAGR